jgi:Skp family chaperone for outer membrane proteins
MKSIVMGPLVGAALLMVTAVATPAFAQQNAGLKVAYVNTREILQKTPGYLAADSTLAKEEEKSRAELEKMRASLDSAIADFERRATLLTEAQRTAKRKAIQEQEEKANQRLAELREQANTRQRELLQPFHQRVNAAIELVRSSGGYAMVFDVSGPSGIVAADTTLDLTAKVIQQIQTSK